MFSDKDFTPPPRPEGFEYQEEGWNESLVWLDGLGTKTFVLGVWKSAAARKKWLDSLKPEKTSEEG